MNDDRTEEAQVQLATRIPKQLHRDVKIHCVRSNMTVAEFVTQALRQRLERRRGAAVRSTR